MATNYRKRSLEPQTSSDSRNAIRKLIVAQQLSLFLSVGLLLFATGCHQILATAVFVWSGPNVPAKCTDLEDKRVVVICQPPSSLEYRHAGAARDLAKRVGGLLASHAKNIEVVDPQDVDDWVDESSTDDVQGLGEAVGADRVVHISLDEFSLYKGGSRTLYQGNADGIVTVYDMEKRRSIVWEKPLGQVLFPVNSAVPAQEKTLPHFRKQFIEVLAREIATDFYEHDPSDVFAIDATAHR